MHIHKHRFSTKIVLEIRNVIFYLAANDNYFQIIFWIAYLMLL